MNRRTLLRGAAGLAAATGLPGLVPRVGAAPSRRRIPTTGVDVPGIGLGSWITFNVGSDPVLLDRSTRVIRAFLDGGGGIIDSSPMYGSSQATIGHALVRAGGPARVFAADKIWAPGAEAAGQLARTRQRWGVRQFDLLQVHNLVDWRANLEFLLALQKAGRLAHVGVTTSHGRRHNELERIMASQPVDFVQLTYNLADREAEARLLPLAREKGIAVMVNRPFRRGSLIRKLAGIPLPAMASELGAGSWAQVLLKFILAEPAVTAAIPATTRVDHVRENQLAGRGPIPDRALCRRLTAYFDSL